jgi:integrase
VRLVPVGHRVAPESIRLQDVFEAFRRTELAKLAGKNAETSRLNKLAEWFGQMTLGQLDCALIEQWTELRLSGLLGSGRNPDRSAVRDDQLQLDGESNSKNQSPVDKISQKPLTKHQRHWRVKQAIKKGETLPTAIVFPVSSQTARHELVLLRRTIKAYFESQGLHALHGIWLATHYVIRMKLPSPCEARKRRLSDDEIVSILKEIESSEAKSALLMSLLTSLRRSELVSLRWEHVDLNKSIIRLCEPGHFDKSKTTTRDVPLLPGAIKLLTDLGIQKQGLIFPITPSGFSQAWRRAADRAGVFDARLHDCRREAISRLIETCKLQLSQVAVFSGHSDLATLQRHYVSLHAPLLAHQLSELPGASTMMPSL